MEMKKNKITDILSEFKILVKKSGNKVAIETAEKQYTFKELDELSDIIMDRILDVTAGKRTRILLYLSHTHNIIVSVLAVLKTGNVYIPVSLKENEKKKKYISDCCNARIVITDQELTSIANTIQVSDINRNLWENKERKYAKYKDLDEIYILFTSGSTGEPKGCAITYGNLLYIINNMQEICPTDENSAYCFSTPYTFDVSTTEIYGWIGGGKVVVCDTTQYTQYRDLCILVAKHKITHLAISPSGFANMLKLHNEEALSLFANQIEYLMVAGEEFKKSIYDKWNSEKWSFRLFNLYGPTEATVYALCYELKHDMNYEKGIPLGEPLTGCSYVIDNVDKDGIGELVLIGDGICLGYINNKTEMNKRFNSLPDCKSYRTGDMVSFENGQLLYHGRNDDQIQINGIRVELGEIEATMMEVEEIDDVCVASNGKLLISYVCLKRGVQTDIANIKKSLETIMPRYKIPNYIRIVDEIPLNENRKSDRKKILAEYAESCKKNKNKRKANQETNEIIVLKHMRAILKDKVGMTDFSVDDNFFEWGGDSLDAFTLASFLEEEFHISLDINAVYLYNTAKMLSEYISKPMVKEEKALSNEAYNLSNLAELNHKVNEFLFTSITKKLRYYRTMYLQKSYYFKRIGGVISFDYNIGNSYTEEDIIKAVIGLLKGNSILRSKLIVTDNDVFFAEYDVEEDTNIPSVIINSTSGENYVEFLENNYSAEVLNARYHEGFLSLFIIASINNCFHIVGLLDHCIADAGCEAIIKRKLGDYLNGKESKKTMEYHEYINTVIIKNTMDKIETHPYMEILRNYVIPNKEEILEKMTNKTCKIEISNMKVTNTLEYTLFISYLTSQMLARKLKRNIAHGITLNNRDYKNYNLSETVGDVHTNMILTYDQGMSFEEYKDKAHAIMGIFGEDYFQPYQAIESDYPILTPKQQEYMDMILGTQLLKVNFLGQYSLNEIKIKEGYMYQMQQDLHNMLNAIYVTAYANKDKLFIYISKDILEGEDYITFEYDQLVTYDTQCPAKLSG